MTSALRPKEVAATYQHAPRMGQRCLPVPWCGCISATVLMQEGPEAPFKMLQFRLGSNELRGDRVVGGSLSGRKLAIGNRLLGLGQDLSVEQHGLLLLQPPDTGIS